MYIICTNIHVYIYQCNFYINISCIFFIIYIFLIIFITNKYYVFISFYKVTRIINNIYNNILIYLIKKNKNILRNTFVFIL